MTDTPQSHGPITSLDGRIEDVCVRFEDVWKAGGRPVVEQYLDELPPDGRVALFRELLRLDLYYRCRNGEPPTPDEYRRWFPDDPELLRGLFADAPPERDATDGDAVSSDAGPGAAGPVIAGRYKLLEKVGEGGMGEVWFAEQMRPVRRQVALKLIKAGMDSKAVLSRFAAESQALSLMDHPNIAKVLDGGRTEAGRPFFAMEFIKGVPIAQFCDDARLGVRERVGLFIPVCAAVQHAHQKGVIHRDLKPSNVLVGLYDGKPVPKVIDFGLAKAMHQRLTEHSVYTVPGLILGTPPYMSPEQAELNNPDIDTRTDVYALGVILYELLTGTTPLDKARFRDGGWPEMLRLIKEEEPPRPSTRLADNSALPDIAARRNLEPAKLPRLVRGELDWIVMKCLEKDRSRRYETASGLALDLQRYLAGEPVLAAPPGAAYRVRKFVRKNRGPVAAAASVFLVLIAGIVGTTVGLVRARQKEAETAAVLAFVEEKIFPSGRPMGEDGGLGIDVKLIDVVRAALPSVSKQFKYQPLIEARLRMMFGGLFHYLGDLAAAAIEYEAANGLQAANLGPDRPDTLDSASWLAEEYSALSRHLDAMSIRKDVLRIRRARLGPEHPDTLSTMTGLALNYDCLGRHQQALEFRQVVLQVRRTQLGLDHPDTLSAMSDVASSFCRFHRFAEAIPLYQSVLSVRERQLGPDHSATLSVKHLLATAYTASGRHAEALKLHREVFKLREAILGPDHFLTLWSLWGLAESLIQDGRGDEAADLIDEGLRRAARSPTHRIARNILVFLDLRRLVARIGPAERRAWDAAWMTPDLANADSLYQAACFHSLLAAVTLTDPKASASDAPRLAKAEADRAMQWLRQAVTAGYENVVHMEKDTDLDALRGRDDFKQLLADLRQQAATAPVPPP